jgi:hypothetical protein
VPLHVLPTGLQNALTDEAHGKLLGIQENLQE